MHPQQAPPRRGIGSVIVGAVLKLIVVVAIVGAVVGLIFYGGVSPDQHGIKNLRDNKPVIGAWLGEWPSDENHAVENFEQQVGVRVDIVDVFLDWYTPAHNVSHTIKHIAAQGSVAMLTWEPHGYTTVDILDGTKTIPLRDGTRRTVDQYIDDFADGICDVERETAQPVIMRIMHEMNGNWYSWGVTYEVEGKKPNSDQSYQQAWRKIHGIFERHCEDTLWIWAVNHFSVGTGATFTGTYPGDAYVDYVGMDGYNWGDKADWGWQGFDTLFSQVYCQVRGQVPGKPILIAETATTEVGGEKAGWIRQMFERIAYDDYPGVVGFVYFNFAKYEVEIQGNMDWPVTSSPQATDAFRGGADLIEKARNGDELPPRPPDEFGQPVTAGPRC